MLTERTNLGPDVHARSAKACTIDTLTGEIIHHSLTSDRGWASRSHSSRHDPVDKGHSGATDVSVGVLSVP